MFEFVEKLLKQEDNIIDQIKVLYEHKDNREVRRFMKAVRNLDISAYQRYCIESYYFGLDSPYVRVPIPRLRWRLGASERVWKLVISKDNIFEQLFLLKKYRRWKDVQKYVEEYLDYCPNEYIKYCFDKYYFDRDVPDVERTAKTLHITLLGPFYEFLEGKKEAEVKRLRKKLKRMRRKVKTDALIRILDGPFKGLEGTVTSVEANFLVVNVDLFGQATPIEVDGLFEVVKEREDGKN